VFEFHNEITSFVKIFEVQMDNFNPECIFQEYKKRFDLVKTLLLLAKSVLLPALGRSGLI
jgi:hypothetical protein